MKDFLKSILPEQGLYFAVEKIERGFIHTACHTVDELAGKLAEIDARGRDAYHACASYARESYKDEAGKTRQRTAGNAKCARSFWCDIDVGADKATKGEGYATVKDAWKALRAFCEAHTLSVPTIVDSGGGIHTYWPLTEDIDKEQWLVVARKLKDLMKSGPSPLLADPSRTADNASILRPVGTTNRKPERKGAKVRLVYTGEPTPFAEFSAKVDAALHAAGGQALPAPGAGEIPAHLQGREARVSLGTVVEPPPLETVRQALKTLDPDMRRHLWWPVLAALASDYGEEGRGLAREWSSGTLRGNPSLKHKDMEFEKQFNDALERKDLPIKKKGTRSILREAGWVGVYGTGGATETDWLNEMNAQYAWIDAPPSIYRIEHRDFIRNQDFLVLFANKPVTVQTAKGERSVNGGKVWLEHPLRREHRRVVMCPGEPPVTPDSDLNTWGGFAVKPEAGSIDPFLGLLARLVPDKKERIFILRWLAHLVQKPAVKMTTALVMWSHQQGVGKNLLFECFAGIIGPRHSTIIGQSELEDRFNGWAADKIFVIGDEVSGDERQRPQHEDKLKGLITGTTVQINEKFQPGRSVTNHMNFVFLSNHSSAMAVDDHDRRYHVVEVTADRLPPDEANAFVKWRDGGGLGHLLHRLLAMDLSTFDPKAKAPETAAKRQMIEDNRSDLAVWAAEIMESGPTVKFGREIVKSDELARRFEAEGGKRTSHKAVVAVFKKLGAEARQIRLLDGSRARVLILANVKGWMCASEGGCAAEVAKFTSSGGVTSGSCPTSGTPLSQNPTSH